ncbi:MAG TPA: class I SAM-dependent methyltransferase [Anaeromyxobacter sp.]
MGTLEHYRDVEFEHWSTRSKLNTAEDILLERYLDPRGATVEAGTGGGAILHELRRRGYARLHGFDVVPEMVEAARRRDASGTIDFRVQDAARLEYPDGAFDQALYLAAVLCFVEDSAARSRALREAHRILRPGGTALFSFLCLDGRLRIPAFAAYARYLALLRRVRGALRSPQLLPWLRRRGRPNLRALLDVGPHVYWYRLPEAAAALVAAGFRIVAAGGAAHLQRGEIADDAARLDAGDVGTTVYFVCAKDASAGERVPA